MEAAAVVDQAGHRDKMACSLLIPILQLLFSTMIFAVKVDAHNFVAFAFNGW